MGSEVEAKYWIRKPRRDIRKKLNLEHITDHSVSDIKKKAQQIAGRSEHHLLIDNVYIKTDKDDGYNAEDLEKKVNLVKMYSENKEVYGIKYEKTILPIRCEEGKDIEKDYKKFIGHLKRFFTGKDKETPKKDQPNKYALRIREDKTTKTTYLTLKCKHGKADERSEEYEFIVPSRSEAEKFLNTLGYQHQPERTKTKEQEKYSIRDDGKVTHIEFNRIPGLGKTPLLEIEVVAQSLKRSPDVDYIFEVAQHLGIRRPSKDTTKGGNLEPRGYGSLLKIVNNGEGYKKE